MTEISRNDTKGQLNIIWEALQSFREGQIPEGVDDEYDLQWSEITTAMAFITEDLEKDEIEIGEPIGLTTIAKLCQSLSVTELKVLENHLFDRRYNIEKECKINLAKSLKGIK